MFRHAVVGVLVPLNIAACSGGSDTRPSSQSTTAAADTAKPEGDAAERGDVAGNAAPRRVVRGHGISVVIPRHWRGEVFSTIREVGGLPSITHLASFPTNMRDFEIGSTAMSAEETRIVLLEFPPTQVGHQGFEPVALPLEVAATDAEIRGSRAVIRRRAALSGRPFSIAIEFGRRRPAAADVRVVNEILRTLTVEPRPDADPALWAALRRPLRLPTVAAGAACPKAKTGRSGPAVGITLGRGPAYPALGSSTATASLRDDLRDERGWYLHKTLWAVAPTHRRPLLIRGARVDRPGALRFGRRRSTELRLPGSRRSPGEWRYAPTYTVIPSPGCYAFQVDGASFSRVIVFAVAA